MGWISSILQNGVGKEMTKKDKKFMEELMWTLGLCFLGFMVALGIAGTAAYKFTMDYNKEKPACEVKND